MCTREDYLKGQEESGIKVGCKVVVTRGAIRNEKGWGNTWIKPMDKAIGSVFEVLKVAYEHGITLKVGGETYNFPYFVLEKVTDKKNQSSEKFYDDCGVELLPGDVVKAKNIIGEFIRIFTHKKDDLYYLVDCGRANNLSRCSEWDNAVFYARPPAKQKYVRSRKEVAQILLDDGYEPMPSGSWVKGFGDAYGPGIFTDCGKKLSDCVCKWEEKFLIER